MSYAAPSSRGYLESRIKTSSQPELQLMLLDGAIRFGRQARQHWEAPPAQQADTEEFARRSIDVVEELMLSVAGGATEVSRRLEAEYAFIYHQLAGAWMSRDGAAFDAALKLLEFQRETWRLACEQLKAPMPPTPNLDFGALPAGGFSIQA